ncbi:unnamed protein product, partial [Closterium sp. NIES-53]
TRRIRSTSTPESPVRRPPQPCCGRGRLAMRRRSGSGDLGRLSATCLRTSCPLALLPASSWGSPPTLLGGSSTTPPLDVFCPPRTSRSTSRYPTTASSPTALLLFPRPRSSWYQ